MKLIIQLNKICKQYKPLIETIGIVIALLILFLTFRSTSISNKLLKLSQQQEYNKQLPIWDFEIIDSLNLVKLKPYSSDIKIQTATAFFSKKLFGENNKWPIDQPNHFLYLTMFKYNVAEQFKKHVKPNTNYYQISDRNTMPVGLIINYIQYGQQRVVYVLFGIQYLVLRNGDGEPKITIKGVLFDEYLNEKKLMQSVDSITEQVLDTANLQK